MLTVLVSDIIIGFIHVKSPVPCKQPIEKKVLFLISLKTLLQGFLSHLLSGEIPLWSFSPLELS